MYVVRALYISLMFHVLIYWGIQSFPSDWIFEAPADVAEIEIIEKEFEDKFEGQIVRQVDIPDKMKLEDDSEARFLSEKRQRVLLETRAKNIGLTQNANPNLPSRPQKQEPKPRDSRDLSGYEPIHLPRPNEIVAEGPSTVGETLPTEIAVGSFTALNTDRFQFYSFFSRIEERVRFRWEIQVRMVVDNFERHHALGQIGRKSWITHVEFLISPDGHLRSSKIMKESGQKAFDQAAIIAFRDARVFPNPPPELVEEDGYIHLQYAFNVYFEPSAFASSHE